MTYYKIEPRQASGRFILASYDQNGNLCEIKFCGEGWTAKKIKNGLQSTPATTETISEHGTVKLNFTKL